MTPHQAINPEAPDDYLTVLAVDDDPADLVHLQRLFSSQKRWAVTFQTASNQKDTLEAIAATDFDLVILDYNLGVTNGLELTRRLKDDGVDLPIILLTGAADADVAVQALRAGVNDYMPKDKLSVNSLMRMVSNTVEKHRLRMSLDRYRVTLEETIVELEGRQEQIKGFYHNVAHELKTPLTGAKEFISVILDGLAGEIQPLQREYLETALANCDRMVMCINDMLDVSRLKTGKLSLTRKDIPARDLLHQIDELWAHLLEAKGLSYSSTCTVPGDMYVDEERIIQVVSNLLSNSVKFTEKGGVSVQISAADDASTVEFRAETGADEALDLVEVSIRDTGRGIEPNRLVCIFDRLYQSDETDATALGGLGLGLSIVKEIVDLHGGVAKAESTVGEGTTIRLLLPVNQREVATAT